MIIEDDPAIAAALQIRFRNHEQVTLLAADAVSGCCLAVRHNPDLIVIDISLPGGNGLELARQFREMPETRDVPFIFITASKDFRLRAEATRLKAAGFLEKPYDAEELLALADHAMARYQLTQDDRAWAAIFPESESRIQKKILIIEDDQKIALGLQLRLRSAGYSVMVALDAATGMTAVARIKPDLILLDISMPAGDGLELAGRIQKNIPVRIPIIFLTASKRQDFKEKASDLRAAGFFEKPYRGEVLLAAVRKALFGR